MKRFSFAKVIALLAIMLVLAVDVRPSRAEIGLRSQAGPSVSYTDFHNGTRSMEIDYGNGTKDMVSETSTRITARFLLPEGESEQPVSAAFPTSLEESTEYVNVTRTSVMEQEVLLGFTYDIAYLRKDWNKTGGYWIFTWEVKIGVVIDIRFGLRLPVNVMLEYPEQMTWGNNYTVYATLNPIDKPDYSEFLFTFKANAWAEVNIAGLPIPLTYLVGPNIDESQSFQTPLGQEAEGLLLPLSMNLFDLIGRVAPSLRGSLDLLSMAFTPYLIFEPTFGSQKITASAGALGDASVVEGAALVWSAPGQRLNFTVSANDCNGNDVPDSAKIKISDFKYYFTELLLSLKLSLDLNWLINSLGIPDPELTLLTVDMTRLVEGLYVGAHAGYSQYVYASIIVNRSVGLPETIEPRDVALLVATLTPQIVYAGQTVTIAVTARNLGSLTEDFNVTVRGENMTIGIQPVFGLLPNEEITLTFSWNTADLTVFHTYIVRAEASNVPNEIDSDDNMLLAGAVQITGFADVDGNGIVDIYDIVLASTSYDLREGDPDWNEHVDVAAPYGLIDIYDIVTIAYCYGKACR